MAVVIKNTILLSMLVIHISGLSKTIDVQLKHPKNPASITEGGIVSLKCNGGGSPEPSIKWFKNTIR